MLQPATRAAAFAVILSLLASCARGDEPICADIADNTPRAADLTCLERWIETEQSWPKGVREQARVQLATLTVQAESLSDEEFYVGAAALVALPDNGHTNLSLSAARESFGLLPIRTHWFDDGLFIVRTAPPQKHLLGAKVLKIAGLTPDQLMAKLQTYYGGPDEQFRAYGHGIWFQSPALLHAAGVSPSADSTKLTVQLADGNQKSIDLTSYTSEEEHPGDYSWRQLHPKPLPREGDGWITWLGESGTELPWAYDDADNIFRYRRLAAEGAVHIQFRANYSQDDADIDDFLETLERRLKTDKPRYILWDQRFNGGGDLTETADFARKLHKWIPKDGHVYVLTSNATFSAGIYTAFFPKWADAEHTTVVGTRVGDREQFWAETGPPIVLPQSGWRIYYSLQMHDLEQGCNDPEICHIRRSRWNLRVGSFEPDVRITEQSADLLAGRDAVVEWALDEIRKAESAR